MGTPSIELVGLVGSLRAGSANRMVFEAARELVPEGAVLREHPLKDLPFYDGDVEAAGDPTVVDDLRRAVEAADGLILFTPEYNRSIPAITKNAIDWLSRVMGDSVLSRATVGFVAATPGRHEATGVRAHLADSLALITAHLHETSLGIGSINHLTSDGRLNDVDTRAELKNWLADFVLFVEEHRVQEHRVEEHRVEEHRVDADGGAGERSER